MIGGCAVNRDARARGIVRDHSAKRRARARRDIRTETETVRLQKRVELIEHDTRADTHRSFFQIEIEDLSIVAREIDDQSFADRTAGQTRSRTARSN